VSSSFSGCTESRSIRAASSGVARRMAATACTYRSNNSSYVSVVRSGSKRRSITLISEGKVAAEGRFLPAGSHRGTNEDH
jgi:hypothetical protein